MSLQELRGKTVLVTGASSGIGRAAAQAFAAHGCRLALAARRADKLASLAESLEAKGVETLVLTCDVRERDRAREAVDAVIRRWGRLDILLNNAGVHDLDIFERQDLDLIEDMVRTNLFGTMYTTHAALPGMRRQGSGHIVNVASIAGLTGLPWMSVYSASKFAVVGFTESLRRELRGSGVRLTAFCPGTVDTAMAAEPLKDAELRKTVQPKTPEETAERIVRAVRSGAPEVVFGEASAFVLRLARFFPRFTDWFMHRSLTRLHPEVRRLLRAESERPG
ncbi:MAG: SDR family oxidoreductase [Elusimicrobiota bacterium]